MTNGTARTTIPLRIEDRLCQICAVCHAKSACRGNAIRVIDRDEPPFLDMSRCWGCLVCLPACPFGAVIRSPAPANF
jgi:TPP-dependent indolepyruvate ferredoxin oxidoreductase alpha subunit